QQGLGRRACGHRAHRSLEQTPVISRRKAREYAMQTMYAAEVGGDPSRATAENGDNALMHDDPVAPETREYGLSLSRAAHRRAEEIDQLISEASDRWDLARLAVVDKVILRMSVAERLTQPDVPARVCIDAAVGIPHTAH